jgi:phosphoribosyl-AMP cyclohydrolase
MSLMDSILWTDGLVPVIVQESKTQDVLMFAYMSPESLQLSLETGFTVFWSRSRNKLWRKGEESGHRQKIEEVRLDCDGDVLLIRVTQLGEIACHTGRHSCFYRKLESNQWVTDQDVIKPPEDIYK